MNYFKQILFELRERPLITWITIAGTALSLFLLMAVYMNDNVNTVSTPPESRRADIMLAPFVHVKSEHGESSGSMNRNLAEKLYAGIEGVSSISYIAPWSESKIVSLDGKNFQTLREKRVDAAFWQIYDYDFVSGSPFSQSEVDARVNEVILSESSARLLGKGADLTGRDILLDNVPHKVKGIVRDPHPLLSNTWSEMWTAWTEDESSQWSDENGSTGVIILLSPDADPNSIKKEVERRYEVFNAQSAAENKKLIYHGSPFTYREQTLSFGSNTTPDSKSANLRKYLFYAVLLILPAINLSGMTRSRLRRRISEIGVRRAYGATRSRIISQLIGENFMLTLIGGILGLIACVIFTLFFSNLFINYVDVWNATALQAAARPTFEMLFSWKIFFVALFFCFILNIISTGIPAWKASRVNPAEAISGKNS